jgi:FG-GAP-like repeat
MGTARHANSRHSFWGRWFRRLWDARPRPAAYRRPRCARPAVEILETRLTPATLTVNTLVDENTFGGTDPTLSLREAIELTDGTLAVSSLSPAEQAQVSGTPHTAGVTDHIGFSVQGTITLTSALPDFSNNSVVNLLGSGPNNLTVARSSATGTPDFSVFTVDSGSVAGLAAFTIANGNNTASGGGISNSGTLVMTLVTLTGNTGMFGGGVFNNNGGTVTANDCTFTNNSSSQAGGGIDNDGGSVTVEGNTFSGNAAPFGGGIDNFQGTLIVSNSTLSANTSLTMAAGNPNLPDGGGIENLNGTLTVTNSTFDGNMAVRGGGLFNLTTAPHTATLTNDTFVANTDNVTAGGSGGGIRQGPTGPALVLNNTIVAGNVQAGTTTPDDISVATGGALATTCANNLIGTGGSGGLTNGSNGNLVGVSNPGLGALANNGGPTQTIALLAGSPAIDAGSNALATAAGITIDQRGAMRGPAGLAAGANVDIGAYEASSSYLVTSTNIDGDVGTLPAAIGWANVNSNVNPANTPLNANTMLLDTSTGGLVAPNNTITLAPFGLALALTNTAVPMVISETVPGLTVNVNGNGTSGVFSVAAGVTATISGLAISGGNATTGGGMMNSGTLTVNGCTFNGNVASQAGGGIDNDTGTLTVTNCTFATNAAPFGGGIDNFGGTLIVTGTTFNGNTSLTMAAGNSNLPDGGGIENLNGTLSVTNSTFYGNMAIRGGGLFNLTTAPDTATLTNVTITANTDNVTAGGSGGGIRQGPTGPGLDLNNTIVAGNVQAGTTTADDISVATGGTMAATSANNLIGTGGSGGLINGTNGNLVGVSNPGLGSLANNGGPTQTVALLASSPAINAGTTTGAPVTDQRGFPRNSRPDIGAFQAGASLVGQITLDGEWWLGVSNGSNAFTNSRVDFGSPAANTAAAAWVDVQVGDFDGNSSAELAGRVAQTGQWWVAVPNGTAGFTTTVWTTWAPLNWQHVLVGDFNGDGKTDLAAMEPGTGHWWVALSNGNGFATTLWASWAPLNYLHVVAGDFNGDGKTDLAAMEPDNGTWWVGVANPTGTAFATSAWGGWTPDHAGWTWDVEVGDFTGNGKDDLAGFLEQTGGWYVAASTGSLFQTTPWAAWSADTASASWQDLLVGDFMGNGKDQIAGLRVGGPQSGQWMVNGVNAAGTGFNPQLWTTWVVVPGQVDWVDVVVGDFNGDGKADIAGRYAETGQWWVNLSSGSSFNPGSAPWTTWSTSVNWVNVLSGPFV